MNRRLLISLIALLWAFPTHAATVRQPLGVYAKIDIEDAISGYPAAGGSGSPTTAQLHTYLRSLLADLLSNPAISGLTVGQRWDNIQSSNTDATVFDWSYLDDALRKRRRLKNRCN